MAKIISFRIERKQYGNFEVTRKRFDGYVETEYKVI